MLPLTPHTTNHLPTRHTHIPLPTCRPADFAELLRPRYRRPLAIGMSLMLFQQITGQPSVLYYAAKIFQVTAFSCYSFVKEILSSKNRLPPVEMDPFVCVFQAAGFAGAEEATGVSLVLGFFKLIMTGGVWRDCGATHCMQLLLPAGQASGLVVLRGNSQRCCPALPAPALAHRACGTAAGLSRAAADAGLAPPTAGIAVATVDSWGRRPLLLYGVSGIVLSLLALGTAQVARVRVLCCAVYMRGCAVLCCAVLCCAVSCEQRTALVRCVLHPFPAGPTTTPAPTRMRALPAAGRPACT